MSGPPIGEPETEAERERAVERLADRLDGPMTVLGVLFLLLVLAETVTPPGDALAGWLGAASWVLWATFVAEFGVRLAAAPSSTRYFRRNWWQLAFLALPFLRFLRILSRIRIAQVSRGGRILSSALRGARTATRTLTGRVGWLGAVTGVVVLSVAQLAYQWLGFEDFGAALHAVALATITGASLDRDTGLAQLLDVVLAVYSVVVFAALAGALGAWFLDRDRKDDRP